MLKPEEVTFLHENGYVILGPFLSEQELATLRQTIDDITEESRTMKEGNQCIDLMREHTYEQPLIRKLKKPAFHYPIFDQIRRHPKTLSIISQLLGPNVLCYRHKVNMKPSREGEEFPWHQDWAYHPYSNDDIYHFGIALDDMSPDNGGIIVISGSHRGILYDHHKDGKFIGAVDPTEVDETQARPIEIKAGDAYIFHIRTLHRSPKNTSERSRRVLMYEYVTGDAWPLLGITDWNIFSSSFILGSPCLEPRWTDVPRRLPFPGLRGKLQKF